MKNLHTEMLQGNRTNKKEKKNGLQKQNQLEIILHAECVQKCTHQK